MPDMDNHTAIEVHELSKCYSGISAATVGPAEHCALSNISFSLKRGGALGVCGKNGSGKSTLLKILAGVTKPTQGTVAIRGRVASILEIGAGFHPDLTGRSNIFLNSSVLGFSRTEAVPFENEIIEFSGVGKFIDEPVKNYSSGMLVRLAFAIIAHLNSDVYLFDEVLSVGDAQFKAKCFDRINSIIASGDKTIVFVSHDMSEIARICDEVLIMSSGKILERSGVDKALLTYSRQNNNSEIKLPTFVVHASVETSDAKGGTRQDFRNTEPVVITVRNSFTHTSDLVNIAIRLTDRLGNVVFNASPIVQESGRTEIDFSVYTRFSATIPAFLLNVGFFSVDIVYFDSSGIRAELRKIHYFEIILDDNLSSLTLIGESGPLKPYLQWTMS